MHFYSRKKHQTSFLDQISKAAKQAVKQTVNKGDIVGVKVHFGEEGNTSFVPPIYIRRIVDEIEAAGGKALLFDTNTLYKGDRENARDHLLLALRHGFSYEVVKAPVMIADGLKGKDFVEVEIKGENFSSVRLGSLIKQLDSCIVVSHVKGHSTAGFGGAIKNISMGFASRSGKQQMHSDVKPTVDQEICIACGTCMEWCPVNAIEFDISGKAKINWDICIGCGECRVTCPENAIDISWETTPIKLQEKMAEYALGSMSILKGKISFINFLINVTPDCDCWEWSGTYLVEDIGVLVSIDPVALDQASCDLLNQAWREKGGNDIWKDIYPKIDWTVQLAYAEKIGVGTRNYILIED
ncbi:MAG: DUF362 domain-containing protein [Actinobacteria bacterium]|nr:DUF362 domain-containing protein [Actinomycetota bacterium]